MENITSSNIKKFLDGKDIAIAGASRNKKKFGYMVFNHLKSQGYNLYPVHPETDNIEGVRCFKSLSDIPQNVRNLYIVTPKNVTDRIMESAVERGFDMIWMQQKSDTPYSLELASKKGTPVIKNRCLFMYLNPSGGHSFHRFFVKLFGKL